jgi:N-acylneuraminate cytidylyltransferase
MALEGVADRDGFAPAIAVLLDPAFPLRAPRMIDDAIDRLRRSGADSLISVYPLTDALWEQDERGMAHRCDPAHRRFVESSVVRAFLVDAFSRTGQLPTGRVVLYEVSPAAALRVEDAADWADIEALHRRGQAARARSLLRGVSLLVLDFDGVMTDNRVLVFEDGREAVLCSRGDGMGLEMLRKAGVPVAVISKEINPVVGARCKKLKIPYLQGIDDKIAELTRLVRERGLELAHVGYMGNDINDLACMRAAGLAIAPADSHPEALQIADLVTSSRGGFGAVREVCDLLLAARAS